MLLSGIPNAEYGGWLESEKNVRGIHGHMPNCRRWDCLGERFGLGEPFHSPIWTSLHPRKAAFKSRIRTKPHPTLKPEVANWLSIRFTRSSEGDPRGGLIRPSRASRLCVSHSGTGRRTNAWTTRVLPCSHGFFVHWGAAPAGSGGMPPSPAFGSVPANSCRQCATSPPGQ